MKGNNAMSSSLLVPTVIETTGRGERAYDIFSRLLRERIIMINGPIEESMSSLVVAQLLFLAAESTEREINLYISSPGGSVQAGLAIYDTMRHLPCPIGTTCVGYAASFGTILLMAGDRGLRRSQPHARIHMHQPLIQGGLGGQATDIDIHAREILHTRDVLSEIIARHTGQSLERIKRDTDRDYYMSATEALEYGIIDEVLTLADK
jgi:ATP-dependent Clp protease protease subunit